MSNNLFGDVMDISQEKKEMRKEILARRMSLGAEEVAARSKKITELFFDKCFLSRYNTFMAFLPFRNEVDLTEILERLLAMQKRIVLPRVDKGRHALSIHVVSNLTSDVEEGTWGIREPLASLPEADYQDIDFFFVPGVAFDAEKYRLGYGGGFYDRFLKSSSGVKIGVCFDFQVVSNVPREPWDIKVDGLLTDGGLK